MDREVLSFRVVEQFDVPVLVVLPVVVPNTFMIYFICNSIDEHVLFIAMVWSRRNRTRSTYLERERES